MSGLPLKTLATRVLSRVSEVERSANRSPVAVKESGERSIVSGSGRGMMERGPNLTTHGNAYTQIYGNRIQRARDWQDLYTVLADAQVAFVNGDVAGEDVERLARDANARSHSLPEHDPTSGVA